MLPSMLPLRISAAIATIALALVAYAKGTVDAQTAMTVIGGLFTFLLGVITHNDNNPPAPPAAK